jgi:hypothetical protein
MKKVGFFVKNWYRVKLVKPGNRAQILNIFQDEQNDNPVEAFLKSTLHNDLCPEPDADIQKMLEARVAQKSELRLSKNSFADFLLPVFSWRHLELKMIAFTVALLMLMRVGPVVNHSINRNVQPAFLADTLVDSSLLLMPLIDSSIKLP